MRLLLYQNYHISMLEELRQRLAPIFEEAEQTIKGEGGKFIVSDIIWWQDLYCANSVLNISTGENADEEDIPQCY